jgi:hypothetical protein
MGRTDRHPGWPFAASPFAELDELEPSRGVRTVLRGVEKNEVLSGRNYR